MFPQTAVHVTPAPARLRSSTLSKYPFIFYMTSVVRVGQVARPLAHGAERGRLTDGAEDAHGVRARV